MKARSKREAQRNASPLVLEVIFEQSTESAKYQRQLIPLFQSLTVIELSTSGDAPHVCSALATGFHIARLWR